MDPYFHSILTYSCVHVCQNFDVLKVSEIEVFCSVLNNSGDRDGISMLVKQTNLVTTGEFAPPLSLYLQPLVPPTSNVYLDLCRHIPLLRSNIDSCAASPTRKSNQSAIKIQSRVIFIQQFTIG